MAEEVTTREVGDLSEGRLDLSMRVKRQAPPVRAQVSEILRQAITEMRFKPGQRLVERELTELTGVSRTSIREALRELAAEGLVRSIPNRGMVVAGLTAREVAELYDVRQALEALAARLFAQRATDDQVRQCRVVFERIAEYVARGEDTLQGKDDFYQVLFLGAGNDELRMIVAGLHTRVHAMRAVSLAQPGRAEETVRELRAMVEAFERRDADAAAEACALHVRRAAETVLRATGAPGVLLPAPQP